MRSRLSALRSKRENSVSRRKINACLHLSPSSTASHTSHGRATRGRSRRGRSATTARNLANGLKTMMNLIKERRAGKGRQAIMSEKKAFTAGAIIHEGPAASAAAGDDNYSCASTCLSSITRHPVAFSATAALDQRSVHHGTVDCCTTTCVRMKRRSRKRCTYSARGNDWRHRRHRARRCGL